MSNNINFQGAIWLKQPTKTVKNGITTTLGTHKQIFNDFVNSGDMLIITRKGHDKDIAEFLTQHRSNFKFYPKLSTKSGFDNEKPQDALNIIQNSESPALTTKNELIDWFKLNVNQTQQKQKKQAKINEQTLKALGYNNKEQSIKNKNGFSIVTDAKGEVLAKVSAPGRYGISFAYIEPKTADDSPLRYAIKDGKIIFQYTSESGRLQFLKNYNKAVADAKLAAENV